MSEMKLVVCGDSFTYGSEIVDPQFLEAPSKPHQINKFNGIIEEDTDAKNDQYRIERIWPTYLKELIGAKEVINLAKPAVGNKWIFETLLNWLLENYIVPNKTPDDIIVVIGWTSIVRKEFFFNTHNKIYRKTLNSNGDFNKEEYGMREFFKWYLSVVQNDYEGAYDFINYNFEIRTFCDKYGIPCYLFNALPEEHHIYKMERKFIDLNIMKWIDSFKYVEGIWGEDLYRMSKLKWDHVPESNFLMKDKPSNSFLNYIKQIPLEERLYGVHPTPKSHKLWAELLYEWISNGRGDLYTQNIIKSSRLI
jgi:hypothetical protein